MGFIKEIGKTLWLNHRKKVIAFVLGMLFAGIAAVSGIPLQEIKDAAKDAANQPAPAVSAPAITAPAPAAAILPGAPEPKAPEKK